MRRYFGLVLLAAALINIPVMSGCSARVRYYDRDHHDYHYWDNDEGVYYQRWETERHRDHKDFKHRSKDEQKEYWEWRHAQK